MNQSVCWLTLILLTWRMGWSNNASRWKMGFNPLNAELNPICHLPALVGAHRIFHVSGLRVNSEFKGVKTFKSFTNRAFCLFIYIVLSHSLFLYDDIAWNSVQGSKYIWWGLVDFRGERCFGAYSLELTSEGDSYGCQIRRQLKARQIAERKNSFKFVLCSIALWNLETAPCLLNKCLLAVIRSIYTDYASSSIHSVFCVCVSTLRASSTGEALPESGFVCSRQYRTLPSHETELRVCCTWQ
jgi:hypothetical protein